MSSINWSELIQSKETEIMDAIKEAKLKAYGYGGYTSGYHYDVEIDEDGDVYVTGVHSQNWQTANSWEGKTKILWSVRAWELDLQGDENKNKETKRNTYLDEIDNYMSEIDFDEIVRNFELAETI
jgi:hypothetical protein